jgi:two-component system, cell cycle sensor histidine kinase and response regulator CckA
MFTPKRILVIEDEQVVARDLQNQLRRLGHIPLGSAASGREAIKMAAETQPDLILMDISLDGPMDGVEASMKIVANRPVPIVYITAYPGTFIHHTSRMVSPFMCVAKPFSAPSLETVIQYALEISDARLN